MLTLNELKERLAKEFDEVTLLELVQADSTKVVEAFSDHIEENYDYFLALILSKDDEDN